MSRVYTMSLEVTKETIDDEEFEKIERIFGENWEDETNGIVMPDGKGSTIAIVGGGGTLYGGESEEEAHKRIRDDIKNEIGLANSNFQEKLSD